MPYISNLMIVGGVTIIAKRWILKKTGMILVLILLLFFSGRIFERVKYNYYTNSFIQVKVSDIKELIDANKEFTLYIGRVTCPWCRNIVPHLKTEAAAKNMDVYYLDSKNTERENDLKLFRQYYKIESVPSVIIFDSDSYRFAEINFNNLSIIL